MGTPLKEKELRELVTCRVCRKKIGETALPILWKLKAERHGLDAKALQRQTGLAMMLGGNGLLAGVMGPDENMTVVLSETTCMVCDTCMVERMPELLEEDE